MADTVVIIRDELGMRVPSPSAVPIRVGNTVTFSASDDVDVWLHCSPGAKSILQPSPQAPVSLTGSDKVTFTFAGGSQHDASIIISSPDAPAPGTFPASAPGVLTIQPGELTAFPMPRGRTQG